MSVGQPAPYFREHDAVLADNFDPAALDGVEDRLRLLLAVSDPRRGSDRLYARPSSWKEKGSNARPSRTDA